MFIFSVDIPTIFESLKFNTYFKAVIVKNVQVCFIIIFLIIYNNKECIKCSYLILMINFILKVKNITDSLGHALKHNTSISRVQITNSQEDQSLVSFGTSLKTNLGNVLQVLDLSHNSFSMESITSLCAGIVGLTHGLPVLNLSHCGISARGYYYYFFTFFVLFLFVFVCFDY